MNDRTHQFLEFCRSKPAHEEYDQRDNRNCALGRFGFIASEFTCVWNGIPLWLYDTTVCATKKERTFGALADRIERQLAEQVIS